MSPGKATVCLFEYYDRLIGGSGLIYSVQLMSECDFSVEPSDFHRLLSGYRLIWAVFFLWGALLYLVCVSY